MVFEIDTKPIQTITKMESSAQSRHDGVMKLFNDWLEEYGHKERYLMWGYILKVNTDT